MNDVFVLQIAVIEGTYLGLHHMSPDNGGRGGTVINVASFGGIQCMQVNNITW